jgi:hypothetical protein
MEAPDFQFLKLDGFSLLLQESILPTIERAIQFDEDGTPNWEHMYKVTDTILHRLEISEFSPLAKHVPDMSGFWVPYKFRHPLFGECIVRVWK